MALRLSLRSQLSLPEGRGRAAPAASPPSFLAASLVLAGAALAVAGCPSDAERCVDLRASASGAVQRAALGCEADRECMPIAMTCGDWGAIRTDVDRREVTSRFERAEAQCGCGGEADAGVPPPGPVPPVACVAGQCRVLDGDGGVPPPDACASLRAGIAVELERGNRCGADADCTSINILTCPTQCGVPAPVGEQSSALSSLLASYALVPACNTCDKTCMVPRRGVRCVANRCVERAAADGGVLEDGGVVDGGGPRDGGTP